VLGGFTAEHAVANRKDLVKYLIDKYDADVCGFQECNPWSWRSGEDDMTRLLAPKYEEVAKDYSYKNCTPLFYKKDKFNVLFADWILFEGLNDANSKSMTRAVFEDKSNGNKFACISTHFWWRYDDEKDDAQRERNAEEVYKGATEIATKFSVPVIVMGDLNSGTGDRIKPCAYDKMIGLGFKDERYNCKKTTETHTWHEYPVRDADGNYYRSFFPKLTMDFFFSLNAENIEHKEFKVLDEEEALISSDHCPLTLTIGINGGIK
ncbi:MAG: endonuclease/exonuclease/phosphatase family protein, partial [Clostridia bacterium]|nr:endonuclease/exonuclease/phosphatase family protein [Clostridia bacterium]